MNETNYLLNKHIPNNYEHGSKVDLSTPEEFNWKLYVQLLKNPSIDTNAKALNHFNKIGVCS